MKTTIHADNLEFTFTDSDIVNPDDMILAGEFNPHNVRGWLLHDAGFTLCVVFADSLQDALDTAADEGKLDAFLIDEASNTPGTSGLPADDYPTLGTDDEEGITRLGNAGEPFDTETLGYVEFAAPEFSIVRLCGASIQARSYHV